MKNEADEEGRRGDGPTYVAGVRPVTEALEAGHAVDRVYFSRQAKGAGIASIKELARGRKVPFQFVDVGKLGRLCRRRDHQDVVAQISPIGFAPLESLVDLPDGRACTVVVADGVQLGRNLGMIMRTAAAAGEVALLLPVRGGHPINEEVVRASAGAAFRVPVVKSANLAADLKYLKEGGYWVYGLDAAAAQTIYEVDWPERRVLVVGNESKGLRPATRKRLDAMVGIPMARGLESLNVAVAVGIVLFEIGRQTR